MGEKDIVEWGCMNFNLKGVVLLFYFQKTKPRTKPFVQRPDAQYGKQEVQRSYRQPETQRGQNATTVRRPFRLQRR